MEIRNHLGIVAAEICLVLALWLGAGQMQMAKAQEFQDDDWNSAFFVNCALPARDGQAPTQAMPSVAWAQQDGDKKLWFQLLPGDIGGCQSDSTPRFGARFWERAELRQYGSLSRESLNEIQFEAEFIRGFAGKRETFFQIHSWSRSCQGPPLVMLMFDWHYLSLKTLQEKTGARGAPELSLEQILPNRPKLEDLNQKPNRFRVLIDLRGETGALSVWMNGTALAIAAPVTVPDCAEPHVKFGIYRPGGSNPGASEMLLDDVQIFAHGVPAQGS